MEILPRDKIFNNIKDLLVEFDEASKALKELEDDKTDPEQVTSSIDKKLKLLNIEKDKLTKQLSESTYKYNNAVQAKANLKKVEKLYTIKKEHSDKLNGIYEKIDVLIEQKEALSSKGVNSEEMKEAAKKRLKIIMEKLMRANKMYPEIYGDVEKETKIFFLTPPV